MSRHELQILSSKWCSVDVQLERLEGVASWKRLAGLIHCVADGRVFSCIGYARRCAAVGVGGQIMMITV